MKKASLLLLLTLLSILFLSACGQGTPASVPASQDEGKTSAPAETQKNEPSQSQSATAAETKTEPEESDFVAVHSEALLHINEDAELYWGDLREVVMNRKDSTRLTGRYSNRQELCRLEVSLNGRPKDASRTAFLIQAVEWLEKKLNADFSETKTLLGSGESANREICEESGDWALTVSNNASWFWINSARFDNSPLPFSMKDAYEILGTDKPNTMGISREVGLDLGNNNTLFLELDPDFYVYEIQVYCSEQDAAAAAAVFTKAAEPFLTEDALKTARDFFENKTASVLRSGDSESLELRGGSLYLDNLGEILYLSIEPDEEVFSQVPFATEADMAELASDPFDKIGFSKAGTAAKTELGEIDGCKVTFNGLVYGEPGYKGPEIGLNFTIDKQTDEAVTLSVTMSRIDSWKMNFVKKMELPVGKKGVFTRTVWTPVEDLRRNLPGINGLPDFALSVVRTDGTEKKALTENLAVATGYRQDSTPTGTVLSDGDLYMLLLDEAIPSAEANQEEKTLYRYYRYRVYLENRSDQPLTFGKTVKLAVNGFFSQMPSYLLKLPDMQLEPGEKALGWMDYDVYNIHRLTGQAEPKTIDILPELLTKSAEDETRWVPVGKESGWIHIEGISAPEIPDNYLSMEEYYETVFAETEPVTVYEDDNMLIQTAGWVFEKEAQYLAMTMQPKKAETMGVFLWIKGVNGKEIPDSKYTVILSAQDGYSYFGTENLTGLGLAPEEYSSLTVELRIGKEEPAGSGEFNYWSEDPVMLEINLKP